MKVVKISLGTTATTKIKKINTFTTLIKGY